jgi:K+-transporting ATPase ATPase B chain
LDGNQAADEIALTELGEQAEIGEQAELDEQPHAGEQTELEEQAKSDDGSGSGAKVPAGAFRVGSLLASLPDALRGMDPRRLVRTPVMFVVEVGAALTTVSCFLTPGVFVIATTAWLWLTVLFASLADAVAERRGRAQAASLRAGRDRLTARRLADDESFDTIPAAELAVGDRVLCTAGEVIPGDGDIIEGAASIDESAITGESAPVIRESGGDRSSVTGGTRVLSDSIVIRITAPPGQSFVDRMIALVEGSVRSKTPNEIALNVLLSALTIIFLLVIVALQPMAVHAGSHQQVVILVSLLVCLIPTTIGALVSAIGVAGMDRLAQRNVLATSGRAVEAAGDVSTLLLDKTGTITFGNRQAVAIFPALGVAETDAVRASLVTSLADPTPEGRSIVDLCGARYGLSLADGQRAAEGGVPVPFSASSRMSGIDFRVMAGTLVAAGASAAAAGHVMGEGPGPEVAIRKGAVSAVDGWLRGFGATVPQDLRDRADAISADGGTPLVVAETGRALGVIHLKDIVKPGIAKRFTQLRRMGIRTVMITGDSPLTAQSIAREAGVDDFLAEARPEDKLALIRSEQAAGRVVAMTGDGTNDAPALAQADVGVAMNSGTAAAKEAGNMVDLDSSPTKLIDIVQIGKQLLITRGALTTFSIANDVAKYFAILPAMFAGVYPGLAVLNIMGLASPHSAILSAVIFNALIIVALIPLALRGVRYRPTSAARLLRRNLWIYGLGGLVLPFLGIKLVDLLISTVPGMR